MYFLELCTLCLLVIFFKHYSEIFPFPLNMNWLSHGIICCLVKHAYKNKAISD